MPETLAPLEKVLENHVLQMDEIRLEDQSRIFSHRDNVTILFDGPNFYGTIKSLGRKRVNYDKLFQWFRDKANVQSIYYFTAISDNPHHARLKSILEWMLDNGVRVRTTNSVKDLFMGDDGKWSGNMDVEIAVAALTECRSSNHIVLATGDGDFIPLVEALQREGKKVTILSSKEGEPCVLSQKLRRSADGFIDVQYLSSDIIT